MTASERSGLWEELCVVEDWLSGGIRRDRTEPDFAAAENEAIVSAARLSSRPDRGECEPGKNQAHMVSLQALPGDSLDRIAGEIARCAACRLNATRTHTVPGQGVPAPIVLVLGEGPGAEEDNQGLPFVGPAGRLLDKMLAAIGVSRTTNCFISNIVKCRPPMNRDPAPDEQMACSGFLSRQIALLQPRIILCVGRVASQSLLGTKEGINKLRGRDFEYHGIPVVATFHPSALLRDETLKRPAWEDLKRLRGILADG